MTFPHPPSSTLSRTIKIRPQVVPHSTHINAKHNKAFPTTMKLTSPSPNPLDMQAPLPSESPSSSIVVKDEKEKTIPFLRQLTEMLQNNEELISFVPGQILPHEIIHGKIIVHDRNRVQSEVLPIYFNHASFASLRRQLSYFSFVRVGKSRQSGVTYTNDAVVDLPDILKLKRRTATRQAGGAVKRQVQQKRQKPKPSSPPLPPPLPSLPPKHQEPSRQAQQQQERTPAATTSADDVASAVRSGTLHAEKTNHNLDINHHNNVNNSNECAASSMFNPVSHTSSAHTSSAATQSSISQSNSSTSSSDNGSNKCGESKMNGSGPKSKSSKAYHKRKGPSLIVKHVIPRKDRARFDRLMSINNIVPFIHLPVGHTLVPTVKKEEPITDTNTGCHTSRERPVLKENKPKYCRERATSHGAIDALLALGAVDRQ